MAALFVLKGADEGKRLELTTPVVTLGRDVSNQFRLHDTESSRRHAELRRLPSGDYQIVDLGSSNGTFVNRKPVQAHALQPGDEIQIGQTILVYVAVGEGARRSDLANRISMISPKGAEAPSEIVKSISGGEAQRLLSHPEHAGGPWLKNALANLSVMYQVTQAVSHILDTDQLLDKIMDLIFETIQADRGCIMLKSEDGSTFQPKAVRFRGGVDKNEKIAISRTITDMVLRDQQGVLVADALGDDRFAPAPSIQQIGIREALCVPMKGRHETLGVLYLDTRSMEIVGDATETAKSRRLTEDHLLLAIAIGHHAALALEETRYHQAMVQSEKLAAVGQTIAAISHHVKNILQGLRSGTDLLKLGMDQHDEKLLHQGWKIVERNQGRIYELVMDMLNYSKDREPALESTDINAIVKDVLELVEPRIKERGITLELKLDGVMPWLLVDPEGVHRALLNVVGNAIDALEGHERPKLMVQTHLDHDGRFAQISVTDNGPGIPAERIEDIFKPFVSSKGSKGTGLGLPVSRKILREHGGDLVVQSQVDRGSRFVLRLPAHTNPSGEPSGIRRTVLSPTDRAKDE